MPHSHEACPECGATDEWTGDQCYSCGNGHRECPKCHGDAEADGSCRMCGLHAPMGNDGPEVPQPEWSMQPEQATQMTQGRPPIQGSA